MKIDKSVPVMADLHVTQGTDTYLNPDKTVHTLAILPAHRKAFFAKHNEVHALLLREEHNPLLEEGFRGVEQRERLGEHYLTHEALTLLIEKKIRHPKKSASGLNYSPKNLFVLKNDLATLKNILLHLNLASGDDAKIIYIAGIHALPLYLRNEQGLIKCFIVDSEATVYGRPDDLMDVIRFVYPHISLYLSTTLLQKDFYSCSTFAIKTIMYFAKHGAEIFPWLEKYSHLDNGLHLLPAEQLMPRLLKMNQSNLVLADSALDTVVSHKPLLTLREYYSQVMFIDKGKSYNSAALLKKYKYLFELNEDLVRNLKGKSIDLDETVPLPIALRGRHRFYSRTPKSNLQSTQGNPIDIYLQIIEFCEQRTDGKLTQAGIVKYQRITTHFPSFKKQYQQRFQNSEDDNIDIEKKLIDKLFFIAAHTETKVSEHVAEYFKFADKLFLLFSTYDSVVSYLKKYATFDTRQPLHDLCLFAEPRSREKWNKTYWSNLIMEHGLPAARFFALAPQIDKLLHSPTVNYGNLNPKSELDKLCYLTEHYNYSRGHEHQEFAKLCLKHALSEADFNDCLDTVIPQLKLFDLLPNLQVAGSEIDDQLKKYRFVKLPIEDLRGLFLGEYSSCCQSLGKEGKSCAIHGLTSQYSGFYVLLDHQNQIIAQSWAWIGSQREFVFDSWEFSHGSKAPLFKPFISRAAELLISYGFSRVLIGTGGRTPVLEFKTTKRVAIQKDQCSYNDSQIQYLLKSAPDQDLCIQWCNYAAQTSINFENYRHVFANATVQSVQVQVLHLIEQKQLSFTDFLALIRFSYVVEKDFLHHRSQKGFQLLTEAYRAYGSQMEQLLQLKSQSQPLQEVIVAYDDIHLSKQLFTSLEQKQTLLLKSAGPGCIDRLPHLAARTNASQVLKWVYSTFYAELTWTEFINLLDSKGKTVLYLAAENKHFGLVNTCARLFHEKKDLFTALSQRANADDYTIFHHLAKTNDLSHLKKMHHYLGKHLFCKLLHTDAEMILEGYLVNYANGSPLIVALFNNAFDVASYLLANFYSKSVSELLEIKFEGRNLLAHAAIANNVQLLKFLHQLAVDEAQWFKLLNGKDGFYGRDNVLDLAMHQSVFWKSAYYIVHSLKSFDHLHLLCSKTHEGQRPTIAFIESAPKSTEARDVIRRILTMYARHPEQWRGLILSHSNYAVKGIINQHDVGLFTGFLTFIKPDPSCFDFLLYDKKGHTGILQSIISTLEKQSSSWKKKSCAPFPIVKKFIDCLFLSCSPEQVKRLLSDIEYLGSVTSTTLVYLLSIIDRIDQGQFRQQWLVLSRKGPVYKALFQQPNADAVSQVMLDYAVKHCGQQATQNFLMRHIKMMFHTIVSFQNASLLRYLYPLIRDNQKRVIKLLKTLFEHCRQFNFPWSSLVWLIEQPEITADLLIEYIDFKKRDELIGGYFGGSYQLMALSLLWKACTAKMNAKELIQVVTTNFSDALQKLLKCYYYNQGNEKELRNEVKQVLSTWLDLIKKDQNLLAFLTTKDSNNKTHFEYTCDANSPALIRVFLQHCDHEQRRQLVQSYTPVISEEDNKNLPLQLNELVHLCDRIDVLLSLKAEIKSLTLGNSPSALFFHTMPDDLAGLRIILNDLNADTCMSMPPKIVNKIWQAVKTTLSKVDHQPAGSDLFALPNSPVKNL